MSEVPDSIPAPEPVGGLPAQPQPAPPQPFIHERHALDLIRQRWISGALLLSDATAFTDENKPRLVVQRYRADEPARARIEAIRQQFNCRLQTVEGVVGLVGNQWWVRRNRLNWLGRLLLRTGVWQPQEDQALGRMAAILHKLGLWQQPALGRDWTPEEAMVVERCLFPREYGGLAIERSESALEVLTHADHRVLKKAFRAFEREKQWEVPVLVLAGLSRQSRLLREVGRRAVVNVRGTAETGFCVTFTKSERVLPNWHAYSQGPICVNAKLYDFLDPERG